MLRKVEETKGPFHSGFLSRKYMQYLLLTLKDPKDVFKEDAEEATQLGNRIMREQAYVYLPSMLLSLGLVHMVNKAFPTKPTGWYKLRLFGKLTAAYMLGLNLVRPLMSKLVMSNELGEETQSLLIRHAKSINSPNLRRCSE